MFAIVQNGNIQQLIPDGSQFTLDGVEYPSNWVNLSTPEEKAAFEADYTERLLNPYIAAERGYIDAVVAPQDTRSEICSALQMLADKREKLVSRKHDNTPL